MGDKRLGICNRHGAEEKLKVSAGNPERKGPLPKHRKDNITRSPGKN
jgi:CRISPR/Cas system-associated endonuclease/helicase Cas3